MQENSCNTNNLQFIADRKSSIIFGAIRKVTISVCWRRSIARCKKKKKRTKIKQTKLEHDLFICRNSPRLEDSYHNRHTLPDRIDASKQNKIKKKIVCRKDSLHAYHAALHIRVIYASQSYIRNRVFVLCYFRTMSTMSVRANNKNCSPRYFGWTWTEDREEKLNIWFSSVRVHRHFLQAK